MKIKLPLSILGVLFAVFFSLLLTNIVSAAPAAPNTQTLLQPNGLSFSAQQWGDEWSNGYQTLQGYTIVQDADGWWVYAERDVEGDLTPYLEQGKSIAIGTKIPSALTKNARPDHIRLAEPTKPGTSNTPNSSGNQPVLVLLAYFSDKSWTVQDSMFATLMFGASGSVKDYYQKASLSQLTLTAASESYSTVNDGVIGWLNLGYNHPNPGATFSSANQLIVKNALVAADSYINFANYDLDSNGYISADELHVVVVVAGYEASYSNNSPSIWSHRWDLNSVTPPTLDGKVLGDYYYGGGYAQIGELHQNHQATLGVIVHELGHDLYWPDLYDIDSSSDGVGDWSIMGTGVWNYVSTNYLGTSPSLPDAWLKWYQGWITPTVVTGTLTNVSIPKADNSSIAYLLRPNGGGVDWLLDQQSGVGEYFLVENRQLVSYDSGLPGCGLNIWHIDESVTYTNSANATESHPLVKMMQADGLDELLLGDAQDNERGDNGDPFPGITVNPTFNNTSTPNSKLYDNSNSQVSVTNISNCSPTMTADLAYTGPTNQAPISNAGPDQVVSGQTLVTLDGSGSYDPDGNLPLTYQWGQGMGPLIILNNPTSVNPTFTAPILPTTLTFYLVVTDSLGMPSTQDWVSVNIINTPPVANAGPDQTVTTFSMVNLDGSLSYDPDGNTPLTYQWIQTSGIIAPLNNPMSPNPTFTAPPIPNVLTFDLIVTDALGQGSAPDTVAITIVNQTPVADAGLDQFVGPVTLVTLNGAASYDPDGNIPLSFVWTQTSGPVVILANPTTSNPTFVSPNQSAVITFSLVVTDNLSAQSNPDHVTISVQMPPLFLPLILK